MAELKWYDSIWLTQYLTAKDIVARVAPQKLEEFVHAFDRLRTRADFAVVDAPNILDQSSLELVRKTISEIAPQQFELHEVKRFGRLIFHDHPVFGGLQQTLTPRVSEIVGEEVEPSYNFLSMYTRLGVCEPHLDSPSAKWTLDICINQSEPWPIHFSQVVPWPEQQPSWRENWQDEIKGNLELNFASKVLLPGNGIVFSGSSQWHYRNPLPTATGSRAYCDLLFFHYIPKGTREIVNPADWARIFGIRELEGLREE